MPLTSRWITSTESAFPWERDALDYLRDRLPDVEPVRAWSNVEFVSLDGRINEVDLIVLTSKGMYLVEIKSRPGEVSGDQQRWTWHDGASRFEIDNPLRLANLKSKRLAAAAEKTRQVSAIPGMSRTLPKTTSIWRFVPRQTNSCVRNSASSSSMPQASNTNSRILRNWLPRLSSRLACCRMVSMSTPDRCTLTVGFDESLR
jgi:hypothetical protein